MGYSLTLVINMMYRGFSKTNITGTRFIRIMLICLQNLNKIRNRVGMPDVRSEYTGSAASFRDRVRNEWAVEFYGEFRRWRDIRRWRIAKDVFQEGIYAVDVTKNSDGTFTYVSNKLDVPRVFEDKHYWYPFHTDYVDMFAEFKQNPGW